MAKDYDFRWQIAIPEVLRSPTLFDRWEEEPGLFLEQNCKLSVDEFGFYLQWFVENKEAQVVDICQISEARLGDVPKDSKLLADLLASNVSGDSLDERSIVIVTGTDLVTYISLHFVAENATTAREWVDAFSVVLYNFRLYHVCPITCLKKHWKMLSLSVNERSKIPSRSITRTFASGKAETKIYQLMTELAMVNPNTKTDEIEPTDFTFERFYELYRRISARQDVEEVFKKVKGSDERDYVTIDQLITFLNETQRDPRLNEILFPFFDRARIIQILGRYERNDEFRLKEKMSFDGFLRYLMSDENAPVFLDRVELYQDMDQPLAHYFVNSSHNTYLTGRQFGGKSCVEMYRQVLLAGCRCIELDCWDGTGDDKGEPIITHGKAMCTDVLFKDAVQAISDTAFTVSEFPVCLSFENHCSKGNQLKMAKYCVDLFGDLLLDKAIESHALKPGVPMPSPSLMKRKILIKNKRLKEEVEKVQLEQFFREGRVDEEEDQMEILRRIVGNGPLEDESEDSDSESESTFSDAISSAATSTKQQQPAAPLHAPRPRYASSTRKPCTMQAQQRRTLSSNSSAGLMIPRASGSFSMMSARSFTVPSSQQTTLQQQQHRQDVLPSAKIIDEAHPELGGGVVVIKDEAHPELKPVLSGASQLQETVTLKNKLKSLAKMSGKELPVVDLSKEEEEKLLESYHYTGATTNIHPYLSSLVNYTHPIKFPGFEEAENTNCFYHMSSFSESAGLGLMKQCAIELVNYNKRQLSRIYPKGGRVDSSNFLPQIFWNAGCQMVALNFQTPDLAMQLNQGKFEYNGRCGYLLKPDFMRRTDRSFDPFSASPVDGMIAAYCSVQVISGHFLSDRKVGTYVEVEMYGLPTDTIRKEFRSRIVPANGLNPIYSEDPFVFRKVVLPELAVLRFAVFEENGRLLGQRILPLDGLQAGYRHISLRTDNNMHMTLSMLFCNIVLRTYVPEGLNTWVDAFADPKGYVSKMDQRQKQLEAMGINQEDIGDFPVKKHTMSGSTGGTTSSPALNKSGSMTSTANQSTCGGAGPPSSGGSTAQVALSARVEKAQPAFEPISVEQVRRDKCFQKLLKKHLKEADDLRKQQLKEKKGTEKSQCSTIDKIVSDQGKKKLIDRKSSQRNSTGSLNENGFGDNPVKTTGLSVEQDAKVKVVVSLQTKEWSEMLKKQQTDLYRLNKAHCRAEWELVRKLTAQAQKAQIEELKLKHEQESKELKCQQTKVSMEDNKKIQIDKNVKTKAEKDRRIKEQQEKNLKLFMEERKRYAVRCQKQQDLLTKQHKVQLDTVERELKKALDLRDQVHQEVVLAAKPETVV